MFLRAKYLPVMAMGGIMLPDNQYLFSQKRIA